MNCCRPKGNVNERSHKESGRQHSYLWKSLIIHLLEPYRCPQYGEARSGSEDRDPENSFRYMHRLTYCIGYACTQITAPISTFLGWFSRWIVSGPSMIAENPHHPGLGIA